MPTLFPSGLGALGCWHIPEAWDCHGADGAGEDVPANEPCPVDLACLLPSARAHNLQIQGVLLLWNNAYCTQRMWSLWAGGALKSPMVSMSPGVGVPTSSLFLGVAPPMDESTLHRVVLKEQGFVQGEGERRRNGTQALGVSPGTFHSDNPGTGLSLRLWFPQ